MCTATPCKCSCDLFPADIDRLHSGPVGGFCVRPCQDGDETYLRFWVKLPSEGGTVHALPLAPAKPSGKNKAVWSWNGNVERPTLTPSVLSSRYVRPSDDADPNDWESWPRVETWHGFITDGRARSC